MTAGRPRKPAAQKRREGTYRADRDASLELQAAEPDPPEYLTAAARVHWKRIVPLLAAQELLSAIDGDALAMLCLAFVEYFEADKAIAANGLTGETDKGYSYALPEVGIRTTAWKKIVTLCKQFGMTPSSRAALKVKPNAEEADPIAAAAKAMSASFEAIAGKIG